MEKFLKNQPYAHFSKLTNKSKKSLFIKNKTMHFYYNKELGQME